MTRCGSASVSITRSSAHTSALQQDNTHDPRASLAPILFKSLLHLPRPPWPDYRTSYPPEKDSDATSLHNHRYPKNPRCQDTRSRPPAWIWPFILAIRSKPRVNDLKWFLWQGNFITDRMHDIKLFVHPQVVPLRSWYPAQQSRCAVGQPPSL